MFGVNVPSVSSTSPDYPRVETLYTARPSGGPIVADLYGSGHFQVHGKPDAIEVCPVRFEIARDGEQQIIRVDPKEGSQIFSSREALRTENPAAEFRNPFAPTHQLGITENRGVGVGSRRILGGFNLIDLATGKPIDWASAKATYEPLVRFLRPQ